LNCTNCGAVNPDGARFCGSCGNTITYSESVPELTNDSRNIPSEPEKNVGLGIVFSALFAGFGHLYAEKMGRGIVFAFIYGLLISMVIDLYLWDFYSDLVAPALIALVVWIIALYDTRDTIRKYNSALRMNGSPPW
jgi:TM2 domain-containing membrane protein YozV